MGYHDQKARNQKRVTMKSEILWVDNVMLCAHQYTCLHVHAMKLPLEFYPRPASGNSGKKD